MSASFRWLIVHAVKEIGHPINKKWELERLFEVVSHVVHVENKDVEALIRQAKGRFITYVEIVAVKEKDDAVAFI